MNTKAQELMLEAQAKLAEAQALATKGGELTAEETQKLAGLATEVKALHAKAEAVNDLAEAAAGLEAVATKARKDMPAPGQFKSLGEFATAVWNARHGGAFDHRLRAQQWRDNAEPADPAPTPHDQKGMWPEAQKTLVEQTGASGGFLVPIEQRTDLLSIPSPELVVQPRATVVPMRRRQIQWPVLDQTNTTSGRPAWFGGVLGYWTEETGYKYQADPAFRQINLVAHKLICSTQASDELMEDSAISLEALLRQLFVGAVGWYREEAFMNGTGAGQPLGIIPAPATFVQGRAVAGAIGLVDIINMLEHSYGNPVWFISRSALPSLMQLNGPAANPSYVFMPNARDGMPGTLFGYPVFWNEHCPLLGNRGDIVLADCRYYLVGDRQSATVDSSKHYWFSYDMTVWRCVDRVDGQPWLSQPIYYSDGTTQVSPFVVLDGGAGS